MTQRLTVPRSDAPLEMPVSEKIALFRGLFRGREDVYALRYEGPGDKSGYFPAGKRSLFGVRRRAK